MLLLAATVLGYALRERSAGLWRVRGRVDTQPKRHDRLDLLGRRPGRRPTRDSKMPEINAIVASLFALIWMRSVRWRRRIPAAVPGDSENRAWTFLVTLGVGLNVIVMAVGTFGLWLDPASGPANQSIAGLWGWISVVSSVAAFLVWIGGKGTGWEELRRRHWAGRSGNSPISSPGVWRGWI